MVDKACLRVRPMVTSPRERDETDATAREANVTTCRIIIGLEWCGRVAFVLIVARKDLKMKDLQEDRLCSVRRLEVKVETAQVLSTDKLTNQANVNKGLVLSNFVPSLSPGARQAPYSSPLGFVALIRPND